MSFIHSWKNIFSCLIFLNNYNSWLNKIDWKYFYLAKRVTSPLCCILTFDPAKNAIPRWCTGRKWHILMAVMRGNRVDGNWLMKWDEVKKFPWYSHRLTHRKRVTCELHDSYFRLMTIKHAISKIEWAIEWALNYYIAQSRPFGGACGVKVIIAGIGHGNTSSNPGLIAFHIALIRLGKVLIQLFSLQLWVNNRAD